MGVTTENQKWLTGPSKFTLTDIDSRVTTKTGWTAATGTPTRTTFITGSVTLSVLAEHVAALIDDLIALGLIGA